MSWKNELILTTACYEYVIKVDMTLKDLKVLKSRSREMNDSQTCVLCMAIWVIMLWSVYSIWSLNMRYCPSQLWIGGSYLKENILSQFSHVVWGGSSDRKRGAGSFPQMGRKSILFDPEVLFFASTLQGIEMSGKVPLLPPPIQFILYTDVLVS